MKLNLLLVLGFALSACTITAGDSNTGSGGTQGGADAGRLNWSATPASMNPRIVESEFLVSEFEYESLIVSPVQMNEPEIVISYSSIVPSGRVRFLSYQVGGGYSITVRGSPSSRGYEVSQSPGGSFIECRLQSENRVITRVEGLCQVRLEVVLPVGSRLEVYRNGRLLTQRFRAMSYANFSEQFRRASFDRDRLQVVSEFTDSYRATGQTLSIEPFSQFAPLLRQMSFRDGRFGLLAILNGFISDRAGLRRVIETEFGVFERSDALASVGL